MDLDYCPGLEDAIVEDYSLSREGLQAHSEFLEVMAYGGVTSIGIDESNIYEI